MPNAFTFPVLPARNEIRLSRAGLGIIEPLTPDTLEKAFNVVWANSPGVPISGTLSKEVYAQQLSKLMAYGYGEEEVIQLFARKGIYEIGGTPHDLELERAVAEVWSRRGTSGALRGTLGYSLYAWLVNGVVTKGFSSEEVKSFLTRNGVYQEPLPDTYHPPILEPGETMTADMATRWAYHSKKGGVPIPGTLPEAEYNGIITLAISYGQSQAPPVVFTPAQISQVLTGYGVVKGIGGAGSGFLSGLFSNKMILYPVLFFVAIKLFRK